ncbi:hypothetical protein [Clostridium thermosuccinogenes]|uniref:hypothetical protein n=1 Tax=Clostridium thermosuccinogenes TaxID=84032 RepID=UPI000CCBFF67|nr:hypothetical protein [Pseudoclostridium thermosuccinogenes]PNT91546.1 hypothetical protein CDQ83_17385 [Pseudoclostridium thermosuccinogenes]
MKVLLLGFTKISYMPYMHFYIEQLKKCNSEIHLLYWDRDGKPDSDVPSGITGYKFSSYVEDSFPIKRKIRSFIKYRRFTLRLLKEQNFDLIIILHSTPGIVLFDTLIREYKNKYILDYRDLTYEDKYIYKKMIHTLVNNSIATFVSSNAYRKYLPDAEKIYTSHNLIIDSIKHRNIRRMNQRNVNPIRIRYWGLIRHKDINMKIIDKLANDARFELHYHGREQETGRLLKNYCIEKGYKNVFFHGEYKPDERYCFIENTDLIHNIYENDIKTRNAMGNKYYDGVTFYIPQLCNEGSFMGEEVKKNGVGITLSLESPNFANEIYHYYRSLDWIKFERCCDSTLSSICTQYNDGINIIDNILNGKKEK